MKNLQILFGNFKRSSKLSNVLDFLFGKLFANGSERTATQGTCEPLAFHRFNSKLVSFFLHGQKLRSQRFQKVALHKNRTWDFKLPRELQKAFQKSGDFRAGKIHRQTKAQSGVP